MAPLLRLPGALAAILLFCTLTRAQNGTAPAEVLPDFGATISILGAMERTDQDFKDGLALDLFSPKNRTLVVTQNKSPLPAQFITGSSGEPFVALSNYSYIIKMSETADDLIAKIEVPYDPVMLARMGIQEANTYVATLSPEKTSWIVDESTRNVHRSENLTRIVKMTSLDGEYMIVGRQSLDTSNIFIQYGQGATRTANFTGGQGVQQLEFIDGLQFTLQTEKAMTMNVDIKNGVDKALLPPNTQSLNSFTWVINSSDPNARVNAKMLVPFNRKMLVAMRPQQSSPSTMLTVAKRGLNSGNQPFVPINPNIQSVRELPEDRILLPQMSQLDGEYVILVTPAKPVGETIPATNIIAPGRRRTIGTPPTR